MKTQSTKIHAFPHSLRSIAASGVLMCQDKTYFYVVPPEKALTIENLFVHLKLTFDAGIASGNRKLEYIGIGNELPLFVEDDPTFFRKIDFNLSADANRKIDVKIDLSHLLNKENAGYRDYFGDIPDNLTYVIIKTAAGNRGVSNVGTINLCKIDAQYTTEGIR